MTVFVSYTPAELGALDISGAAVVAIDCFRASTSIVAALSSGARAVRPFLTVEEVRGAARGRQGVVTAGERKCARVEGFDLGNSPREFSPDVVEGKEVFMSTTNGTALLTAAAGAASVYVAGFVNARATANALSAWRDDIIIAAAGTEGLFSVEDSLCAGLIAGLLEEGRALHDSALFARLAYQSARDDLRGATSLGRGAANIMAAGLGADIDVCLAVDSMPVAARVEPTPLRVVRQ